MPDGCLSDLTLAFTGTNARPLYVEGLDEVCGAPLDEDLCERILRLANKQIQPMKSTFSPSTYRPRRRHQTGHPYDPGAVGERIGLTSAGTRR